MKYQQRLTKLRTLLKKEGVDLLIVEDPIDLYYMTGLQLSAGRLLISLENAALFVDGRYREICQKNSPFPVQPLDEETMTNWFVLPENSKILKIGFDTAKTTYKQYMEWNARLQKIGTNHPKTAEKVLHPLASLISILRIIKDKEEITCLKKAAILGSKGFDFVLEILKVGITEAEVASELEIFWKRQGGQGLAFESIIAFGRNSSMPHYRPGSAALQERDPVLIDIGVKLFHYHSDMTRTIFFGEPPKKMRTIYEVVQEAQQKALDICMPGILISDLDAIARGHIESKGFGKYFTHNLGHGVGLEIHEAPSLNPLSIEATKPLEIGMVITIEPGIYLPDLGGVRIEDTIVITPHGHENLTNRPKSLLICR